MTINPINPLSSDNYSSNQSSENIPGELNYAIQSLETFIAAAMGKSYSPSTMMNLYKELDELKNQVANNQITNSGAAQELQEITQQMNDQLPVQYTYPTESPPYGAQEQLEAVISFLNVTSSNPEITEKVQELLDQLNNGTLNSQQAMQQLLPIITPFHYSDNSYPIPTPSDYPT